MPIVIGINPVKKKALKKPKKKGNIMPKKRGRPRTKTRTRTRTITKYITRRPPRRPRPPRPGPPYRPVPYRARRRESTELDLKKIVCASFSVAFGMIVSKAAVNKLTEGGSEQIRWTWPNIATAAASSLIAAFAVGALFRLKRPTVGLIAIGGVALAGYKAFTCKLAPKWGWSESWFGADEIHPEFLGEDDSSNGPEFQVVENVPMLGATDAGGQVVPYNPAMGQTDAGGQVVKFDPAMGQTDWRSIGQRVAAYPGSY